jgi:amino acid adenylation domain-containing protein
LDQQREHLERHSVATLPPRATADDLAYLIYTSGSTGQPKGVAIPRNALANLLNAFQRLLQLSPADRWVAVTTLSFDIAGLELFLPLQTGAQVVLATREQASDAQQLAQLIASSEATLLQATPATWRMLLADGWIPSLQLTKLCGGEALPRDLAAQLLPGGPLWNVYGPTETTIWSTALRVTTQSLDQGTAAIPIGLPLDNTDVYVLDGMGQPLPVGGCGELFIGGLGLARGYFHREQLTAERFVERAVRRNQPQRLYRTGDTVRWRHDGILEYLGRNDDQVKLRGFRIELGEIRAALVTYPGIQDAVCVVRQIAPGDARLVAYYVSAPSAAVSVDVIRQHVSQRLPEYMIPSLWMELPRLPLTPNGKVDRRALPAPALDTLATGIAFTPPATSTERRLALIWQEVLGLSEVGRDDDFFLVGGHSLLATQLVSRIRSTFEIELPLRTLFESSTLAQLAAAIDSAQPATSSHTPLLPADRTQALPLSSAQQRLWFLDQLEPNHPFYNVPIATWLNGPLDAPALEASLAQLVARHELLRTTFPAVEGRPQQVIHSSLDLPLVHHDLRSAPAAEREPLARSQAVELSRQPFDLAQGPLLRAHLWQLDDQRHLLLLVLHHIVCDGWSMGVLVQELTRLYQAQHTGSSAELAPLPIQYADFAAWQQQQLDSPAADEQLAYWRQQLAELPPVLELPTDRPRPARPAFRGGRRPLRWSATLSQRLQQLSQQEQSTLFMTLLAGWQTLLYRLSGQSDLCIGTPIANRTQTELEPLIGFFANTLVLRGRLAPELSFRQLLAQARETTLAAYTHQEVPFERLVEALQPQRSRQHAALFQVALVWQNAPLELQIAEGLSLEHWDLDNGTSKYDLTLILWPEGDHLSGALEYNSELFDAATVDAWAEALETLLASAAEDPAQSLSHLPLLSPRARHQLLVEWNDTRRDDLSLEGVERQFVAQAARTPDALAVVGSEESLTYRQLDERSNQLARELIKLGVTSEVRVGLLQERTPDLLVSLLAVLKAGGAYVPLDPAFPRARLAYLLEDSAPTVVLTTSELWQQLGLEAAPSTHVLCLDQQREHLERHSVATLPPRATADDLAYLIYTSGSTGQPKGVAIPRNALANHAGYFVERYELAPGDRVLQAISLSFDAAGEEIFPALVAGQTLVLVSDPRHLTGRQLLESCRRHQIALLHLPTALWHECVAELPTQDGTAIPSLKCVLVGGETPRTDRLAQWQAFVGPRVRFLHAYGVTEATISSTIFELPHGISLSDLARLPIGTPIANSRAYVLDAQQQPVPAGAIGQLYVAGAGLARSYWRRPDLTAERFPTLTQLGERLYATGDLVRWSATGQLEFCGRCDEQIKLRGLRIEPGEIQRALTDTGQVRSALVALRNDDAGQPRLTAYVVPNEPADSSDCDHQHVDQWETLFDATYRQASAASDPTFNIAGWNSTYTQTPIPAAEMRSWVDETCDRIRALQPKRVLEIGCGSGLILWRVAPHCQRYVATDFSAATIDRLQSLLREPQFASLPVELHQRRADEFHGLPRGEFDVVVINSVVQYFPSAEYLRTVLRGALECLRPGGTLYLGDIRSHELWHAMASSVELFQASDDCPLDDLRRRVERRQQREQELLVSGRFFAEFIAQECPGASLSLERKLGPAPNELNKFRYEVAIQLSTSNQSTHPATHEFESWWDALATSGDAPHHAAWIIRNVADPRLQDDLAQTELLDTGVEGTAADLRASVSEHPGDLLQSLAEFATANGRRLHLALRGDALPGTFDAVFLPGDNELSLAEVVPYRLPSNTAGPLSNRPAQRDEQRTFVRQLRQQLAHRLPSYMLPSPIEVIDRIPLTVHGKIDFAALPAPRAGAAAERDVRTPRDEMETQLVEIWSTLLDVSTVGIDDDFFELGGHSLLAVRMMTRIEEQFGRRLALGTLFQRPTVEYLAEILRRPADESEHEPLIPIQPRGHQRPLFCVHPAGGTVFCYRELAQQLGFDQPVFGLEAAGLDGATPAIADFSRMAASYVAAIKRQQPTGPYRLAGWSLGGNLAFEMARQLESAGDQVEWLGLLDAGTMPSVARPTENDFLPLLMDLFPGENQLSLDQIRALAPQDQLKFFVERAVRAQLVDPDLAGAHAQGVFAVFQANLQGILAWQPGPISAPVTLVKAHQHNGNFRHDATFGWSAWCRGPLTVKQVECDHVGMLQQPAVSAVAKHLQISLETTARSTHEQHFAPCEGTDPTSLDGNYSPR